MNLVHMLDAIQKKVARAALEEEMKKREAYQNHIEQILANISTSATRLIEQNYASSEIAPSFTAKGLEVIPSCNDFLSEIETQYVGIESWEVRSDARGAWNKFVEGWRKAGITATLVNRDSLAFIRFTPIHR